MLSFYPLLSPWIIVPSLAAAFVLTLRAYRCRHPALTPGQHRLLFGFRTLSLLLLGVILMCPGSVRDDLNTERSHIVFLLDRSGSMSTRDMSLRKTRLAVGREFLEGFDASDLQAYPRHYYTFNQDASKREGPDDLEDVEPERGTDLRQAVDQVRRDVGLSRVSAFVLLSDGLDTSEFDAGELACPVFSVMLGTDLAAVPDTAIEPFDHPEKVSENEEIALDVPLGCTGYQKPQKTTLEILHNGVTTETREVTLVPGKPRTETFNLRFKEQGVHRVEIHLHPRRDEAGTLNNHREIPVEVVEAKTEVFAYFPLLTNSFRPLLREFENADDIVFTACYKLAPGAYGVRGANMNATLRDGIPESARTLAPVTCVILGAHNGDLITPAEARVLKKYTENGGALIFMGGSEAFGRIVPGSALKDLLPVRTVEDSFRTGTWQVKPSAGGKRSFVRGIQAILATNTTAQDMAVRNLNIVQETKPSGRVLVWAEGERRQPLIVWQRYGQGKTVAVLSSAFHLWGPRSRQTENYGLLWRELVAFARTTDDVADILNVAVNKTELEVDEALDVSARVEVPEGAPGETVTVAADLFRAGNDTVLRTQDLRPTAQTFEGRFEALTPGRYVLRVQARQGDEPMRQRYVYLLVGEGNRENVRLKTGRDTFRTFSSDDHIYTPEEGHVLARDLHETVLKNKVKRETFLIYDTPYFFLGLLGLLMTEWYLRRRFNLF